MSLLVRFTDEKLEHQEFFRRVEAMIVRGVQDERFRKILGGMVDKAPMRRIGQALAPIVG